MSAGQLAQRWILLFQVAALADPQTTATTPIRPRRVDEGRSPSPASSISDATPSVLEDAALSRVALTESTSSPGLKRLASSMSLAGGSDVDEEPAMELGAIDWRLSYSV